MFRFIQTSEPRSDCTADYDVQLDKDYTVRELLETVLTGQSNEWGTFHLLVCPEEPYWKNPSCEYRRGKRIGTTWTDILISFGDRKIALVKAYGGWGLMDYFIWLDN